RFQNHFRSVFPRLRLEVHLPERFAGNSAHSAVNVGEPAPVQKVEYPAGDGRSEVLVQRRHGTGLDVAAKALSHNVLVAAAKTLHKRFKLSKIVRAVGVTHQHIFAANKWQGIDVSSAQTTLWHSEHAGASRKRNFTRQVGRAVDNDDLASDIGLFKALQ